MKDDKQIAQQFLFTEYKPLFQVSVVQSEEDDIPTVTNETLDRQLEQIWKISETRSLEQEHCHPLGTTKPLLR